MIRFRWSSIIPLPVLAVGLAVGGGLAAAPASAATSGTFSATGSMNNARVNDTVTVLANGQVLAAGGGFGSVTLASAELYNPATGTWAPTGSMATARANQTATLLNNGQVLVAGGANSTGRLASAELYSPATGTWASTGSLGTPRDAHSATLLPDGDVLVTAGVISGRFSELYNPATGQWSDTSGGLATCSAGRYCRLGSTATLLGTGNVLLAGGLAGQYSNPSATTTALLYDPATNVWTSTGSMQTGREAQTANVLPDGQVLVAGGAGFTNHVAVPLASAELYSP